MWEPFVPDFQAFLFIIKPEGVLLSDEQALEFLNFIKRYKVLFSAEVCHSYIQVDFCRFFLLTGCKIQKQYK